MSDNFPNRQTNRLREYDYSQNGLYFITICTNNHENLFGSIISSKMILNETGNIVDKCWNEIPKHFSFIKLLDYVIMPNHLHGLLEIDLSGIDTFVENKNNGCQDRAKNISPLHGTSQTIGSVVRGFKIGVTKWYRKNIMKEYIVWQRNYHDHIVRNEISHNKIANYIIDNPQKWEIDKFYNKSTL